MKFLDNVKKRIGLDDNKQDDQLQVIIDNVEKELLAMLPTIEDTYRRRRNDLRNTRWAFK